MLLKQFIDKLKGRVTDGLDSIEKANILRTVAETLYPGEKIAQVRSDEHEEVSKGLEEVCKGMAITAKSNKPSKSIPALGSLFRASLKGLAEGYDQKKDSTDSTEEDEDMKLFSTDINASQPRDSNDSSSSVSNSDDEDSDEDMSHQRRTSIMLKKRAKKNTIYRHRICDKRRQRFCRY